MWRWIQTLSISPKKNIPLHWLAPVLLQALWCATPVEGIPSKFVYTLPSHTRSEWVDPADGEDSVHIECFGIGPTSVPLKSLQKAYLYRVTSQGGVVVDSHAVIATGGVPDSFPVPGPGTYYIRVRSTAGWSCESNAAVVYPDIVTGVDPEPILLPTHCSLFDVHGRLVMKMEGEACWRRVMRNRELASGVYWVKWTDGTKRKVVILK